MKKKIIHIAQSAGGVAEYIYMLMKNMNKEQYTNILIVSEDYKEQINRFQNLVEKIYFVPMIREINIKSDFLAVKEVRKILKLEKPDIIYLHSSKAGAIGRIALLFNMKTKIVYNAHGWYFNAQISKLKKKIFAIIERILALKTNKIINISKSEYTSAIQYKIAPKKKMCIIENGIDFSKFEKCDQYRENTRKAYQIKENEILIGVVGRISEQKDPMTSIKAFKLIHEKNKNTKFMFIGSGELEKQILEYAKQNKIEKDIIITGWIKEVEKYIPAFDIAILPSKWEGFGLVLIEYMACDKPIIASNVGGIADIIQNEKNGYLIPVGNEKELAKKIELLIYNQEKREEFINNNKINRQQYTIVNVIKKHEEIFKEK